MNCPIYDFLKQYKKSEFTWGHMPGHKGRYPYKPLKKISSYDLTEISGADELFMPEGIIEQSEENASKLYGTAFTCFSTGGSTLCIQSMLAAAVGKDGTVIAARNAHKAFINATALLNITPIWIKPSYIDNFGVSGEISPDCVKKAIENHPEAKAVYITSPDYLGCISDIKAIALICHKNNKLLLVDNAHGAHLAFLEKNMHPIALGADICCDSEHKTLPAFTGAALLHFSKNTKFDKQNIKDIMAVFATTSPSYITMLSMDLCNKYLNDKAKYDFKKLYIKTEDIVNSAKSVGFEMHGGIRDVTKIALDAYSVGYTGHELAEYFRKNKIECEYEAARHIVLILTPFNSKKDFSRIKKTILSISKKDQIISENNEYNIPKTIMSIRNASFSDFEIVNIKDSYGKIAAKTSILCPPGVPVVIAGESIDENVQKLLKLSGILRISVVK